MHCKKISMLLVVLGGLWFVPSCLGQGAAQNTTGHDSLMRTPQYQKKSTTPAVVHDTDLIWAQTLQKHVTVNGYQATPAEIARYTDIFNRLQPPAADSSLSRDSARRQPVTYGPVTQQELQWALQLEKKVLDGYKPTQSETDQYADIATRLSQASDSSGRFKDWAKPFSTPDREVGPAEIQWALALEQRVKQGQQPTAEETARYEDIAKRLAAKSVQSGYGQTSGSMTEPLNWALEWLQKTNSGQTGTAAELAMYRWCLKQYGFRQQLQAEAKKQGLAITLPE